MKKTQTFIGMAGLHSPTFKADFMPCTEVGWRFIPDHWGMGYATEAASAVIDYGFEALELSEIVSFCVKDNVRSQTVMQRLGMQADPSRNFDHPKPGLAENLRPHVFYSLCKKAWQKKNA